MSLRSQVMRIINNIREAYTVCDDKGATLPQAQNSANLATTIGSIPESLPKLIRKVVIANGVYNAADDNADGYDRLTVRVPDESENVLRSLINGSITSITSDALYIRPYTFYRCTFLVTARFTLIDSISQNVFQGCSSLKTIECPLLRVIGNNAFFNLTALETVDFPLLEEIWDDAFSDCASLEAVDFPLLEKIGVNAFGYCTSLEAVDFPLVETIGEFAFTGCTSIEQADFPLLKEISEGAFMCCTALTTINFPLVETIGELAFEECTSIEYFDMSMVPEIPDIASTSFEGTSCRFLFKDQNQLEEYARATNWSALADRFQIKGAIS